MPRFKLGQEVVCVSVPKYPPFPGPKKGEIVIVGPYGVPNPRTGCEAFEIVKYNRPGKLTLFDEKFFEPLADISELKEILNAEPCLS